MDNKEFGGVVLAFFGFVLLVGAVKGTWRNAWGALTGNPTTTANAAATSQGSVQNASMTTGGKGSAGNASTNLPGSAPAPFSA